MEEEFDIRKSSIPERENEFENVLRPLNFQDFRGQNNIVENLKILFRRHVCEERVFGSCFVAWTSRD